MSIICPICKQENLSEARFCGVCGASLVQKCQLCDTEQSLGLKFCIKCGGEISKADEKIRFAEKMRGTAGREIAYKYKGFVYNSLNPISHAMADRHTIRHTLDADEYVIKDVDEINFYYGDGIWTPPWRGHLYLTNKNLFLLGYEPKDRIESCEIVWPLKNCADINFKLEKALIGYGRYLYWSYEGNLRKVDGSGSNSFTPEWAELMKQYAAQR
jgi:hypothetical protein